MSKYVINPEGQGASLSFFPFSIVNVDFVSGRRKYSLGLVQLPKRNSVDVISLVHIGLEPDPSGGSHYSVYRSIIHRKNNFHAFCCFKIRPIQKWQSVLKCTSKICSDAFHIF